MSARGFVGAGDLYISRYNPDTASFEGFKGPFEATKFEIKPSADIKELTSKGRSTYGQVLETVALAKPAEFSLEMPEVNKDSLSLALMGTPSTINQGSGTWLDQPLVVTAKDVWLDLGKKNVAEAGLVVTNSAGTTTYVLGTDYDVNYKMGWLRVRPTSAIAAADTLKVDGTYAAVTGTKINGATQAQMRMQLRLHGVNMADGLPVLVDVWEAVVSANAAFDFLAGDFAKLALPGRLKTPTGKTDPFEVQMLDAA